MNPIILTLGAITSLAVSTTAWAQGEYERLELTDRIQDFSEVSARAKPSFALDPNRELVVDGRFDATTWLLAYKTITFKPGATLVFSEQAVNDSREIFIVADRIVVTDPMRPPTITWEKPIPVTQPDRGQAGAGPRGRGHGGEGGQGSPGAPGASGALGVDAPALTLMIKTASQGAIRVDLRGGDGGKGGSGQRGGDGGSGEIGSPARQARTNGPFGSTIWHPWCDRGPGHGGRGGNGGLGGNGGVGGSGGRGGSFTIISMPDKLPVLTQVIKFDLAGGRGGEGGEAGAGGNPGPGGPEGQLASFCNSAGRVGAPGSPGAAGGRGDRGETGPTGRAYVGSLTTAQFSTLFGL